jgi:hypothetical protein
MRFPQVKIGQRFSFEDKRYTKTGPLTASEEGSGRHCMIRRSAEVIPLDMVDTPPRQHREHFTRDEVLNVIFQFRRYLKAHLEVMDGLKESSISEDFLKKIDAMDVTKEMLAELEKMMDKSK